MCLSIFLTAHESPHSQWQFFPSSLTSVKNEKKALTLSKFCHTILMHVVYYVQGEKSIMIYLMVITKTDLVSPISIIARNGRISFYFFKRITKEFVGTREVRLAH